MDTESRLPGGRVTEGVARSGETVRRATGPWTPTAHSCLRHLQSRGFVGAPRVLGVDQQGRDVLTLSALEAVRLDVVRRPAGDALHQVAVRAANVEERSVAVDRLHDRPAARLPARLVAAETGLSVRIVGRHMRCVERALIPLNHSQSAISRRDSESESSSAAASRSLRPRFGCALVSTLSSISSVTGFT
jgi:hypothetical protein